MSPTKKRPMGADTMAVRSDAELELLAQITNEDILEAQAAISGTALAALLDAQAEEPGEPATL